MGFPDRAGSRRFKLLQQHDLTEANIWNVTAAGAVTAVGGRKAMTLGRPEPGADSQCARSMQ
ncbi:MAG TPA: hypothetical protein EYG53_05650 [Gammaproteobacteria bacterium]|nr:hypothetical protein [Gammaproteobacteria bacterium]